jgi:hypothetical protein
MSGHLFFFFTTSVDIQELFCVEIGSYSLMLWRFMLILNLLSGILFLITLIFTCIFVTIHIFLCILQYLAVNTKSHEVLGIPLQKVLDIFFLAWD